MWYAAMMMMWKELYNYHVKEIHSHQSYPMWTNEYKVDMKRIHNIVTATLKGSYFWQKIKL